MFTVQNSLRVYNWCPTLFFGFDARAREQSSSRACFIFFSPIFTFFFCILSFLFVVFSRTRDFAQKSLNTFSPKFNLGFTVSHSNLYIYPYLKEKIVFSTFHYSLTLIYAYSHNNLFRYLIWNKRKKAVRVFPCILLFFLVLLIHLTFTFINCFNDLNFCSFSFLFITFIIPVIISVSLGKTRFLFYLKNLTYFFENPFFPVIYLFYFYHLLYRRQGRSKFSHVSHRS